MLKNLGILAFFILFFGWRQIERFDDFDRIVFHSDICFGTCPIYHLQLDKSGNVELFAEMVYKDGSSFNDLSIDSTKVGYFVGKADSISLKKLANELHTVRFREETFEGRLYTCGSRITIIIYRSQERHFFSSSFPTPKATGLIEALYEICETADLRRCSDEFEAIPF